jgi:hypothetical protein
MSLVRIRPAPYHALVVMLASDRDARAQRKLFGPDGFAKMQILSPGSLSWGFWRDGEQCVACAGLLWDHSRSAQSLVGARNIGAEAQPREGLRYEAWFTCLPAVARDMKSFVRLAQLTLDELPQDAVVEARVAPGWTPGEKLARLLGFERRDGDLWERIRK